MKIYVFLCAAVLSLSTSLHAETDNDGVTKVSFKRQHFALANKMFSLCPEEAAKLYKYGAQAVGGEMHGTTLDSGRKVAQYKFLFKKFLPAPAFTAYTWELKAVEVRTPREEPLPMDAPGFTISVRCDVESIE